MQVVILSSIHIVFEDIILDLYFLLILRAKKVTPHGVALHQLNIQFLIKTTNQRYLFVVTKKYKKHQFVVNRV